MIKYTITTLLTSVVLLGNKGGPMGMVVAFLSLLYSP